MGVGLGLGASSLSSRAPKPTKKNAKPRQVTKETQPTQHQVPQMPNPPLQSHTIAHQGQINLYKRGNMSTATTGHSHCPLITLSSLSAAKSTGNRKAPPMSWQKSPKRESHTDQSQNGISKQTKCYNHTPPPNSNLQSIALSSRKAQSPAKVNQIYPEVEILRISNEPFQRRNYLHSHNTMLSSRSHCPFSSSYCQPS